MQHGIALKKLNLDLFTPRVMGLVVCEQNICYHVATLRDFNAFDMQHDLVLKKLNFVLLPPRVRAGGLQVNIFVTMLLHFVIHFNLICSEKVEF